MSLDDDRHRSLVKCLQLADWLKHQAVRPDLRTMAARLDVSTRTVIRYLIALENAGYPLPPMPGRQSVRSTRRARAGGGC